jgi:hypothetical protein
MRQVFVDIEKLVLKGFRYKDRHVIAAAIQEELTSLLSTSEAAEQLAGFVDVADLDAGEVRVEANAKPYQLGAETADAIGRGLLR